MLMLWALHVVASANHQARCVAKNVSSFESFVYPVDAAGTHMKKADLASVTSAVCNCCQTPAAGGGE